MVVFASMDTYYERTIDDGSRLLAGSINSIDLETVTFLRFNLLPAPDGELATVELVLFSDTEIQPSDDYDIRISLLEEPFPDEAPYWPGPPDGSEVKDFFNATTDEDTTSTGVTVHALRIGLPAEWVAGWLADSESNYGLRISGNGLRLPSSGIVEPRFRSVGQITEGSFSLSPRLETLKTDQTDPREWPATTSFFILRPTLGPVGHLPFMQTGGIFGYRLLLRFPLGDSLREASVNKALLTLKVDESQPDLNQGFFDVVARAVAGADTCEWSEDSTNVDVKLEGATTPPIGVDTDEDTEIVLDVTALVELFGGEFFDVAVLRAGTVPALERAALLSSETADSTDASFLKLVYTTPPGGRFTP